jgi:hypothetical protein
LHSEVAVAAASQTKGDVDVEMLDHGFSTPMSTPSATEPLAGILNDDTFELELEELSECVAGAEVVLVRNYIDMGWNEFYRF